MKIRGGVFVVLLLGAVSAQATTRVQKDFVARYPATAKTRLDACATCHSTAPALNPYGTALRGADLQFAAVEALDSDGDGGSNLTEIQALKHPGNAKDKVAGRDTTARDTTARDTTRAGARPDTTKTGARTGMTGTTTRTGTATGAGAGVAGTTGGMASCEALLKRHHEMSAEADDLDTRMDALVAKMDAATGAAKSTATAAAVRELAKQRKAHREKMTGLMGDMMAHMHEHMRNPNLPDCPAAKAMSTHGK